MQTTTDQAPRLLRRCPHRRLVGGVAAGAAEYFDVDPAAVRIAIVVLALVGGVAVPLYLAAWLLIPEEDRDRSIAEEMLLSWGRPERGCEESTWAPPGEGSRPVGAGSRAVSGDI